MFDLRYHVASLAAVFIALVIGILVGVGISGRGLVSDTERAVLQSEIDALRRQRDAARLDREEARASAEYERRTYDAVMQDRLLGRQVAVVYVGPVEPAIQTSLDDLFEKTSSRQSRLWALEVPINPDRLERAVADVPDAPRDLNDLGRMLAQEFVNGGDTPLWDELRQLAEEQRGGMQRRVDGVVIARTVDAQRGPTARFLAGFYSGLASVGVPVVGVEIADEKSSTVAFFDRFGFSTVDNVDTTPGRVALAVLLQGDATGNYGIKPTHDDFVPEVEPVTRLTG